MKRLLLLALLIILLSPSPASGQGNQQQSVTSCLSPSADWLGYRLHAPFTNNNTVYLSQDVEYQPYSQAVSAWVYDPAQLDSIATISGVNAWRGDEYDLGVYHQPADTVPAYVVQIAVAGPESQALDVFYSANADVYIIFAVNTLVKTGRVFVGRDLWLTSGEYLPFWEQGYSISNYYIHACLMLEVQPTALLNEWQAVVDDRR